MSGRILGIWGAGGLGREVLELAKIINSRSRKWAGFVFIVDDVTCREISGIEVLEYAEAKERYGDSLEVIVGIGEPAVREKKYVQLEADNATITTLIHPDVYVPESTQVGHGVIIQYGCFVSCNVVIDDYVCIQPQCNIGHDAHLRKGCVVSGFSNLAGGVDVGENTYLAMSTVIRERIAVGSNTIIGMGSIVHKAIPDNVIAMGNPVRPMKKNEARRVFK